MREGMYSRGGSGLCDQRGWKISGNYAETAGKVRKLRGKDAVIFKGKNDKDKKTFFKANFDSEEKNLKRY